MQETMWQWIRSKVAAETSAIAITVEADDTIEVETLGVAGALLRLSHPEAIAGTGTRGSWVSRGRDISSQS